MLFAMLPRTGVLQRGRARVYGICTEPRAKHQPRCGNDLASAALPRSVSPFLPPLPSRPVPSVPSTAFPRRVTAAGIIGFSSDTSMRLVDVRGWRRWY